MRPYSLFVIAALLTLSGATVGSAASPREEALRLAPPDAALVAVVQNAREHFQEMRTSPFTEWLPASQLGQQLLGKDGVKSFLENITPLCRELGTTPDEVIDEVLGDVVVFAYSPSDAAQQRDERAVFLIRPRKPETLQRIVERVNAIQLKSGELTTLTPRTQNGEPYFERKKATGTSDFYCFRGSVFAFSSTEADIQAVIDRDKLDQAVPELARRIKQLGLTDAAGIVLVNPRALDAEFAARITEAKPDERALLEKFREVWAATEYAAVYLTLDRDLEVGVAVHFDPDKMPAWSRGWLNGTKTPSAIWPAIPDRTLFAISGRCTAAEVLDLILALLPEEGKQALTGVLTDAVGPIIGKDKLPLVLKSLGPDWALWAEPPDGEATLPTIVAALRIGGTAAEGKTASKAILQGLEFGFQSIRVAYNGSHEDQIEILESEDGTTTITSLVNDKLFPAGCRPSFALKGGYLLLASNPDAIRRFTPPTAAPMAGGETTIARFSGTSTRQYLQVKGPKLAAFLSALGDGNEKDLTKFFTQLDAVLELVDSANVYVKGDASNLRIGMRVKLVKPLKK